MDLLEKYTPILHQYWLPILLGSIGLMFLVYGMIGSFAGNQSASGLDVSQSESDFGKDKPDILFEAASTSRADDSVATGVSSEEKNKKQIVVDVEGAVEKPGVYMLGEGGRIHDALIAAGGMSKDADREVVAKRINLAGKVADGGKIYIPFAGDELSSANGIQVVLGTQANSPVDINHASQTELDSLPGISPVISEKIINNRPYTNINELVEKKIVGNKVFDEIKEKITVQ